MLWVTRYNKHNLDITNVCYSRKLFDIKVRTNTKYFYFSTKYIEGTTSAKPNEADKRWCSELHNTQLATQQLSRYIPTLTPRFSWATIRQTPPCHQWPPPQNSYIFVMLTDELNTARTKLMVYKQQQQQKQHVYSMPQYQPRWPWQQLLVQWLCWPPPFGTNLIGEFFLWWTFLKVTLRRFWCIGTLRVCVCNFNMNETTKTKTHSEPQILHHNLVIIAIYSTDRRVVL